MRAFLIGLQFLTRISISRQEVWTEEDFGRSVRYFPLVGAVLGMFYATAAYGLFQFPHRFGVYIPYEFASAILLAMPVLLTGAIHCDGFMDTVDGIFSGRSRERMLEIMKDSRTGSFGVVAFVLLMLIQWSALMDIGYQELPVAVFVMPIIGRLMMSTAITLFPYARPDGMGKAFAQYASRKVLALMWLYSLAIIAVFGKIALISLAAAMLFMLMFARHVTAVLGGLTGDVYGAICTMCELVVLITFLLGHIL